MLCGLFWGRLLLVLWCWFWQSGFEDGGWCPAVHTAALVWALGIVADEIGVENGLHLINGLEPGGPAFDAEVFVEKGAMQALDDVVGLRPLDPGSAVFDVFQLQEQLVGVLVGTALELAAIVGQNHLDPGVLSLEGGQRVGVHQVHGSDWQLGGVGPGPSAARVAVHGGLQVDFADTLGSTKRWMC